MLGKGQPGYVITLDIPVEQVFQGVRIHTTLRYAIFFLDLKAEQDVSNDFVFFELLSVYDVNLENQMSPEKITRQKRLKTNLSAANYKASLEWWDLYYESNIKDYGGDILKRMPVSERNNLKAVQTPTADAVRKALISSFDKDEKKEKDQF